MDAGLKARCTPATPAEIEAYRRKKSQESATQPSTDAPVNSTAYDDTMKKLREIARRPKPSPPSAK
jgi:hypothetical protein